MNDQDEHRYLKDIERADQARAIIENPIFEEAFTVLRAFLLHQWENTNPRDKDERESLWHQFRNADLFHQNLKSVLDKGEVSKKNLQILRDRKNRFSNLRNR